MRTIALIIFWLFIIYIRIANHIDQKVEVLRPATVRQEHLDIQDKKSNVNR